MPPALYRGCFQPGVGEPGKVILRGIDPKQQDSSPARNTPDFKPANQPLLQNKTQRIMSFITTSPKAKPLHCLAMALGAVGAINEVRAEAVADLMVGYSATWRSGMGGTDQTNAAIYNQIAGANNIAVASGSPHRQNVIGTKESAHDPTNEVDCGAMIGWMSSYNVNIRDVIDAGNALGADLFAYIGDMYDNGAAAQAEQPGRFSCYEQAWWWQNVAAHESGGHNYGCAHEGGRTNPTTIMMHNYCNGGSQGFYSNPNIWLGGVQLFGGMSGCTFVGGADNTYHISTTAQGKADLAERRVWGSYRGALKYRWQFNQPAGAAPAGTIIADEIVSAQAIVRGQGATYTGTALRLPGGTTGNIAANSIAAYLDLPNGMFSAMTNFTIEVWAAPRSAQNWMRVIDIGRTTEAGDGLGAAGEYTGTAGSPAPGGTSAYDDIMLSASIGTNLNSQRFEAKLGGAGTVTADSTLATTATELHHYAITFADTTTGGTIKWFRDGALIKTLNVTFHSASLHDVNNWLGRSLYSGDAMANIDYYDVRIQNVAIADGEVAANYRIGTNDKMVTMWASDAWGSSGWVNGAWEFGQAIPDASHDYETGTVRALTPWTTTDSSFPGRSLTVTSGNLILAGKNAKTATVNDLRLNGGYVTSFGDNGSTQTLAGNITVRNFTDNQLRGANGPLVISANISGGVGGGSMIYTENAVTLTGNNTGYLGATIVGDGRFSTLKISNETQLGGNPTFYGGGWLQLNRGILETTQTMTIDDINRGVVIGPSGGFFRPAPGTTLTIATTLNSPAAGNTLQTAPMDSNPILGIFFKDGAGTLVLTSPNNSHNAEMQILQGELRIDGSGRINNGDHWMPVTLNGTLNYNSTATQTLRGAMSGNGTLIKSNTGTLNINGSNPFTGSVTVNAGTLYTNPANAATNRAFSYVSGITVNSGGTLRTGPNGLFGSDGTQEKPITVNAGGTLIANGGLASDVGVGTVTLNGGTLATVAAAATDNGSFRFDNGTDKLAVTADSTVSATNVKFGNAAAAIDVASGKTLNFTGTITDATSGGISYLTKTGVGTLALGGSNAYTGATAVNAGTLLVNGSIGSGAVTIASGATLGGLGTIGGAVTVQSGGTISPGTGVATLTASSSLTLQAGSTSYLELNKSSSSNDRLVVGGAVTFGGTLTVVNLGGALTGGDSFALFQAGSYSGSFTTANLPALSSGLTWDFNAANGTLSVVSSAPPAPWTSSDIGSVGIVGSSSYNSGTYTIAGSGADIWDTADAFRYVSQTLSGNGEIRARLTSITNTDPWAKAGVMLRDGSAAGAANAFMLVSAGNGFSFQWRAAASSASNYTQGSATNGAPNNWIRLTRCGNLLTGYSSADGINWTQQGSTTISMSGILSVGLAVTSHNNAALSTATFDNVSITPYPLPWLTSDIGTTGLAGSAEFFGGAHTVKGAGTFGGTSDGFRYVYQNLTSDGSIIARVNTLQNTGTSSRVGVVMRDSLVANARMAALTVSGSGSWRWERRTTAGGSVTATSSSSGTAPNLWVRLVRSGNSITASRSTNGTSWTTISSVTVAMASNCYVGLAVASGSTGTLNTSVMDNVTVVP